MALGLGSAAILGGSSLLGGIASGFGGGQKSVPSIQRKLANELLLESIVPGFITGQQRGGKQNEGAAGIQTQFLDALGTSTGSILQGLEGVQSSVRDPQGNISIANSLGLDPSQLNIDVRGKGSDISQIVTDAGKGTSGTQANLQSLISGQTQGGIPGLNLAAGGQSADVTGAQGNVEPTDFSGQAGQSLLPPIAEIGDFNTVFEKRDADILGESGRKVFDTALSAITNPEGATQDAISNILNTPAPQSIPDPPSVGSLVTETMNDLPANMQQFVGNILQDASPQQIESELDNFSQTLEQQAASSIDSLGGQIMSRFAQMGLTSGAALEASKAAAIEVATRTNAQIAEARLGMLDTLVRARDQGVQLMNSFLSIGAQEQANIVRTRVANLESQTAVQTAKIAAAAEASRSLAQVQATQLNLIGDMFDSLVDQSTQQETARIDALKIPFEILMNIGQGGGTVTKS